MDLCISCHSIYIYGIITYVCFQSVLTLRLTRVDVPSSVIMGDPVWLNCSYDLESDDLYSIKWYHSNGESHSNEFYRWLPKDIPPGQRYESRGIYLDLSKSSYGRVYLSKTDLHTDGTFRCEVSAEAPSFQTVRKEKEMRVYSLPKEGPTITGIRAQSGIGEFVNVTCHAGPSKPMATLTWLINGEPAEDAYLRQLPSTKTKEGLQESVLQLQFYTEKYHFVNGMIRLLCTSVISQEYSMSSEEIIISDHAKASHTHSVHDSDGPIITGGRTSYDVGDLVNLTCTSGKSFPAPQLKFYINEREADPKNLRYHQKVQFPDGNEMSSLGLQFTVDHKHFGGASSSSTSKRRIHKDSKQIRLKCTATLSKVIDTNSRETTIGSSQQSSGLHIAENRAVNMNRGTTTVYSILSAHIFVLIVWCCTLLTPS